MGREVKSKPERSRGKAEKTGTAGAEAETGLEGQYRVVSNYILGARDVENITGNLRDIDKMVLLSGRPRRRGMEQGKCQRFMIGEKGKLTGF